MWREGWSSKSLAVGLTLVLELEVGLGSLWLPIIVRTRKPRAEERKLIIIVQWVQFRAGWWGVVGRPVF